MKNGIGSELIIGITSGLVVLVIGGLFAWFLSDIRDIAVLNLRVERLESDQSKLSDKFNQLSEKFNTLGIGYAHLEERVNSLIKFNSDKLVEISKSKNIPQKQVDKAIEFLKTNPDVHEATHYLQVNMGFSPDEVKAIVRSPLN